MTPEIKGNWSTTPLKLIAEVVMGQAPEGDTYNTIGKGLALIAGAADLGDRTPAPKKWTTEPTKVGKPGDIIVCVRATIGDLNWADQTYCYGRGVAALRVGKGHDPEFVWYWLMACRTHLVSLGRGATFKQISKEDLSNLDIPLLPIAEQRRVVGSIKECMERVEEVEDLKNASRIQQQYLSASLIESELHPDQTGNEGWSSLTVGELVTAVRNGRSIAQDTAGQANGAVLSLTAVRGIDLGISFQKPIALPDEVARQFGIDANDVFVSRANTIELVGLSAVAMEAPSGRLIYPDLLIKLKVNPELILPRYLAYALRSASSRKQIKARALGSSQTMVKISGERLREISIPVPSLTKQATIVARLDAAHDLMRQLSSESIPGEVESLRSAILRKAFIGEL